MAKYAISGVWKNGDDVITHYAFHEMNEEGNFRAVKKSKSEAIKLLETSGNTAITWIWNYKDSKWNSGQNVVVANDSDGKYLKTSPDNKEMNNLKHLIDYYWIAP
ncbi:Protein of unknown function [Chryseobacterium oranimense]|uniref:DUF3892 domain-containing protein n=1 Tax=Chryseobacterium oranimense TaxID=421058 RepID=A0A1M5LQD5_9FLAO|nr:DUF3892 domain-containing protein [Chryseobacterium oranimense]SHG67314.1 Protein of unknown function [Chryseobacterium oranimense]